MQSKNIRRNFLEKEETKNWGNDFNVFKGIESGSESSSLEEDDLDLDEREDRLGKIDNSDVVSQASLSVISQDTDNNSVDPYANVQPYDFEKLPSHKCAYCGVHEPNSVVKCLAKDCNKWFCNGKGLNEYGSHIILHLAKRKHKEISLHPESELKDVNLACHTCNSKNIFMLGYTPAKTDFYAILLCREPCLKNLSQKESVYDCENWQPLIENKALLNHFVRQPTELEFRQSRKVRPQQINLLEELWKDKPSADLKDLEVNKVEKAQQPVLLRYKDPKQYKEIFEPLIKLEADYDKDFKASHTQNGIKIRWDKSMSNKRLAFFNFASDGDAVRLVPGDELKVKYISDGVTSWKSRGTIVKITANEEICLELKSSSNPPNESKFTIEFVWKSTSFDRMKLALKIFLKDETSVSEYIFYKILGYNTSEQFLKTLIPKQLSVPGQPELNHFQINAVKKALVTPLCLVQGPPGTGKTVTSTTLVYHLVKQQNGKVLVCAPSNIAVDQLTDRINGTGVKVVRLCARSRESVSSNVNYLSLHEQVRQLKRGQFQKMQQLMQLKEEQGELNEKDDKQLKDLIRQAEEEILKNAEVVCTTCVAAFDRRLRNFKFRQVLIDEATQATEPESLIPILKGAKHVILVGDHCQLGPVIMCKKAAKAGMNQSLFERLVCLGVRPIRLQVQYRMHPCLSNFPSITFYEGSLQNGISKQDRILSGFQFPWPQSEKPMMFYHSVSNEEISASSTSYLNRVEAQNIEQIVTAFFNAGLRPDQIGIITPYEGQRAFILSYMQRQGQLDADLYKQIEVASVDSFQGREKDFILLSCVRSNEASGIGFLNDPRRLNVALTRAKYGLIIFGNARVLSKHDLWNNLLYEFKFQQCLVEGQNLSTLKPCTLVLKKPVKYNPDKREFVLTEQNLSNFDKTLKQPKKQEIFETQSELSGTDSHISYGNRVSQFGFTDMFGQQKPKPKPEKKNILGQEADFSEFN